MNGCGAVHLISDIDRTFAWFMILASMSGVESSEHLQLKKLALFWAQEQWFTVCATEVRLPKSNYRADVAAYKPLAQQVGLTAVFECKQSREDFIRDSHRFEATRALLKVLEERRAKLEELLKVHQPSLRNGETLFQAFDRYDFTKLEHKTYQRLRNKIALLQNRFYDKTKFEKVVRYRCANLCYLVANEKVGGAQESPVGWGLLVSRRDTLQLQRKPTW